MTITRAKIDVSIPRKRRGDCSQHEKGLNKFYDQVEKAFNGMKCSFKKKGS